MEKLLLTIGFILTSVSLSGQIVTYEFLKPGNKLSAPKFVKRGKSIVFLVKDVNTFLYDVDVKGENVDTGIENTEFLAVFNSASQLSDAANTTQLAKAAAVLAGLGGNSPITFDEWKSDYQYKLKRLDIAKNLYQSLYNLVYKDDRSNFGALQTAIASLDTPLDFFPSPGNIENIEQEGKQLILDLDNTFKSVEAAFNALPAASKAASFSDFLLLLKQNEKVQGGDYTSIFKKLAQLYSKATDPLTFNVQSDPITATKDLVRFRFAITPKKELDPNIYIPKRVDSLDLPLLIPVKGGVKFDFSGGFFANLGSPLSKTYRTIEVGGGSSPEVMLEEVPNRNQLDPFSVGAMAHVSPRWITSFKPAISVGFSLNTTDLKYTAILLGGSVLIKDLLGVDNRWLVISCGFTWRKVDYLNPGYNLNQVYAKSYITEPLSVSTWRGGIFLGLSYNFTGKAKSQ